MTQTGLLQIIFFVLSALLSYGLSVAATLLDIAPNAVLPFLGAMLAAMVVSSLFTRLNGRSLIPRERRHFAMVATVIMGIASLTFLWLYMYAGGRNEFSIVAAETSLGTVTWLTTLVFMVALVLQYGVVVLGLWFGAKPDAPPQTL